MSSVKCETRDPDKSVEMPSVVEYLESFNRKERFFLIGTALGNPSFRLPQDFRARLSQAFGVHVPPNAFAAMDYHLDWIHASLLLPGSEDVVVHPNTEPIATGNQQDVDLLVAFDEGSITHLLLLEAKVETGWTNKQMLSKADRLRRIFGDDGMRHPQVKPHFGLMSPRTPQRLDASAWPSWMTREGVPIWLELSLTPGRRRITRCDRNGRSSATGGFFRVSP